MSKLISSGVVLGFVAQALAKLEPLVPPIGMQEVWQAGLPTEVHVNYDVPTYGLIGELDALKKTADVEADLNSRLAKNSYKTSFLSASPDSDVDAFYEAPPLATVYESSYQTILSGLKQSVDSEIASMKSPILSSLKSSFFESLGPSWCYALFSDILAGPLNHLAKHLYTGVPTIL